MSASRPKNPTLSLDSSSRLRWRSWSRKHERAWFLLSLSLHVLTILALVYLTPVHVVVRKAIEKTRTEMQMSAKQLKELAETLEERSSEDIRRNTEELERMLEDISKVHEDISVQFKGFEEQQRAAAAEEAALEMENAIKNMATAIESIRDDAPIAQTDRLQALAEHAQMRALKQLDMAMFDTSQIAEKQKRASAAHQDAKAAHNRHRDQTFRLAASEQNLETSSEVARKAREELQALQESHGEDAMKQKAAQLEQYDQPVSYTHLTLPTN